MNKLVKVSLALIVAGLLAGNVFAQSNLLWEMDCPGRIEVNQVNNIIHVGCLSGSATDPGSDLPRAVIPEPTPGAKIDPFPSAPVCDKHSDSEWHSLWNSEFGCHYDHEHGFDPLAADVLSDLGDYRNILAQAISYPWATPHENALKHEGYKWDTHLDQSIACQRPKNGGQNTATAWAIQYHALGDQRGATTRIHSFFIMTLICDPITGEKGLMMTGGHQDFGQLVSPYQGEIVPLHDAPQPQYDEKREPYRAHACASEHPVECRPVTRPTGNVSWISRPRNTQGNGLISFQFRARDYFDYILEETRSLSNPTFKYWCGGDKYDPIGCEFNATTARVVLVQGHIDPQWDGLDGMLDGKVTYSGFTDVWGNLDPTCTETGAECVPLLLTSVPIGSYRAIEKRTRPVFHPSIFIERDIYFCGSIVCSENSPDSVPSGWIGENN